MNTSHSLKRWQEGWWQEGSGLDPPVSPSLLHRSGCMEDSPAAPEGLVQGHCGDRKGVLQGGEVLPPKHLLECCT